jgi:hypothetical protein
MARSVLIQCGKGLVGRIGHLVLVPSVHLGPAYVTVVEGTALLLRLAGLLRVDVEQGVDRVLCTHGVRAAVDPLAAALPRQPSAARPVRVERARNP